MTWDKDVSHVLQTGRLSSRLLVLRGSNTETSRSSREQS